MLPGVRPSIALASLPTASTRFVSLLMATIDGSRRMIPRLRANTRVFAVPRSIARSDEKSENRDLNPMDLLLRQGESVHFHFHRDLLHGLAAGGVGGFHDDVRKAFPVDRNRRLERSVGLDIGPLALNRDGGGR